METFCTFFWGTLGVVAGLAAPGVAITLVASIFSTIGLAVRRK